jgi:hypothetical protein
MPLLPTPFGEDTGWLTGRQAAKAQKERGNTELAVYCHGLEARARALMDQQDSQALADATTVALTEEIAFLNHGLALAGPSAAAVQLVARKTELLSNLNSRRIVRRFG